MSDRDRKEGDGSQAFVDISSSSDSSSNGGGNDGGD
jgi:hypothetical protein